MERVHNVSSTWGRNVLELFILTKNDSLIIKTEVIPGYSDHDAVFVEGNIIESNNQQTNLRDGSLIYTVEKQTGML